MSKKLKSPFAKLHGKRVLIPYPVIEFKKEDPDAVKIHMPDGVKEDHDKEQQAELIKKYMRIKVLAVGSECDRVKPNDEIYIPARVLAPGRSDALEIDGEKYFIIAETDIAATY